MEIEFIDPDSDELAGKVVPGSSQTPGRVRRSKTNALELALHAAVAEAERQNELARQVRTFPPLGTQFLYRGLWRVEKGIVPIFTCMPACAVGPFEFLTGEAIIQGNVSGKNLALLDEMLIDHVIADLEKYSPQEIGSIICVPVHYENLALDGGVRYAKVLEKFPIPHRNRLLLEIINLSEGVGQATTLGALNRLRPYCHAIIGRLASSEQNFSLWRELNLFAVGVDVEVSAQTETLLIQEIDRFVSNATRAGYRTYVRGVTSRSLAASISTNGVHFLDGPAIDEGDLDFQAAPLPYGVANIYDEI